LSIALCPAKHLEYQRCNYIQTARRQGGKAIETAVVGGIGVVVQASIRENETPINGG
jgi:hypothetical protein